MINIARVKYYNEHSTIRVGLVKYNILNGIVKFENREKTSL